MTRTALYRHFDAQGALLYVGITDCLHQRDKQHAATAAWHDLVERTETVWFGCREGALVAERQAVLKEKPLHNVQHSAPFTDVRALIDHWPRRRDFALEVGVETEAAHKWAKFGRIPSEWMLAVVGAAQARGLSHVDAEWMLRVHARKAGGDQ